MNPVKVAFVSIVLVIVMSLCLNAQETRSVRGSYINVRAEGHFKSPVVTKKLRGDTYSVIAERNDWAKVRFTDGTEGWIFFSLVERTRSGEPVPAKTPPPSVAKPEPPTEAAKPVPEPAKTEKPLKARPPSAVVPPVTTKPLSPRAVTTSKTAEELYNEAIDLYEKGRYAQALELNRAAESQAPNNAEILNNIGNCLFKMGRINEAISSWLKALQITPRSARICNNLGIAYYQLDNNEKAIEFYKKAILFEPGFPDPYYNLASVYGFQGNFEDALVYYRKYLEFNPDPIMRKLAEERIEYCSRNLKPAAVKE